MGAPEGKGSGPKPGKANAADTGPSQCTATACKSKSSTYGFCSEHFDQFKFGLIKKTGEPVPDYEKKLGHYLAHKQKRSAHKVA